MGKRGRCPVIRWNNTNPGRAPVSGEYSSAGMESSVQWPG